MPLLHCLALSGFARSFWGFVLAKHLVDVLLLAFHNASRDCLARVGPDLLLQRHDFVRVLTSNLFLRVFASQVVHQSRRVAVSGASWFETALSDVLSLSQLLRLASSGAPEHRGALGVSALGLPVEP